MEKKDYSKLRPFDLEAARNRGELLTSSSDISQGNPIWKYAAGPDSHGMIIATVLDDGHFANPASTNAFRMAPLAWVRKSADDDTLWPIYKGDVLWHSCVGKCEALGLPTLKNHDLLVRSDKWGESDNAKAEFLTFTPPKVKREGWVNVYSNEKCADKETYSGFVSHAFATKELADKYADAHGERLNCIRIEWEEPA